MKEKYCLNYVLYCLNYAKTWCQIWSDSGPSRVKEVIPVQIMVSNHGSMYSDQSKQKKRFINCLQCTDGLDAELVSFSTPLATIYFLRVLAGLHST